MYRIVLNETSYYGAGCRSVIADEIRKRGFKKVLLVTDKDLIRFGVAAKIEEVLRGAEYVCAVLPGYFCGCLLQYRAHARHRCRALYLEHYLAYEE